MNNLYRQNLGKKGEEIAEKFLSSHGLTIVEKNFHKRYSEIDIVALDGKILVFVEVKTRFGTKFGLPEESVTPWKLRSLVKSAYYYKLLHPKLPESLRIDVVAISFKSEDEVESLNWYKNITL